MEEQRALFMLWQDAYSLKHLLERPHLNEVAFKNTPLDRSAVCTQLASLVAHAQAVSPKTRATLPGHPMAPSQGSSRPHRSRSAFSYG